MRSLLVLLSALVLSSCAPAPDSAPSSAERRSEIIGGTLTTADPAVVSLAQNHYGAWSHLCTGTLIAPRTILTAAHCTTTSTLYALFGSSTASPSRAVKVIAQYPHPGYDSYALTNDIAVMKLETPVPDVKPIPLNETSLDAQWVDQPLRQVGFGVDSVYGGGSGIKREIVFAIRSIDPGHVQVGQGGSQICFGDSGGPGFITLPGALGEVVAGVASYTVARCTDTGYDTRVDAFATSFVEPTMDAWENPTCAPDLVCVEGCTPIDQDCACAADGACTSACTDPSRDPDCPTDCRLNGVCSAQPCPIADADCKLDGETCAGDHDCLSKVCVADAQSPRMYCSRACSSDAECPDLMECVSKTCAYKQRPVANVGDACTDLTYCLLGSFCTGATDTDRRCAMPCGTSTCDYGSAECLVSYRGDRYCDPTTAPEADAGTVTPVTNPPVTPQPAAPAEEPPASGCASGPGRSAVALLALAVLRRRRSI